MAYRRAVDLLPKGRSYGCMFWKTPFERGLKVNCQTGGFNKYLKKQNARTLHTGSSMMVAKLLSVEELFAKRSLRGYLKKMEIDYHECLKAVDGTEEHCSEDELRAKRTRVSLLAPLIHSIRELETKQRELAETETLLEGEVQNILWRGRVFIKPNEYYANSKLQNHLNTCHSCSAYCICNSEYRYIQTLMTVKKCLILFHCNNSSLLCVFVYPPRWRPSPTWTGRDRKRKLS